MTEEEALQKAQDLIDEACLPEFKDTPELVRNIAAALVEAARPQWQPMGEGGAISKDQPSH